MPNVCVVPIVFSLHPLCMSGTDPGRPLLAPPLVLLAVGPAPQQSHSTGTYPARYLEQVDAVRATDRCIVFRRRARVMYRPWNL